MKELSHLARSRNGFGAPCRRLRTAYNGLSDYGTLYLEQSKNYAHCLKPNLFTMYGSLGDTSSDQHHQSAPTLADFSQQASIVRISQSSIKAFRQKKKQVDDNY